MKIFTATLDTLSRIITTVFLIIILATIYQLYKEREDAPLAALICMGVFFVVATLIGYALSVKHFIVDNNKLIIRKHFGLNREILFTDIASTEILNKDIMGVSIRTMGSGGLFGYFGKYRNKQLGGFTLYATSMKNWVLLTLKNGKKVVISPDDAEGLNQVVSENLGR